MSRALEILEEIAELIVDLENKLLALEKELKQNE